MRKHFRKTVLPIIKRHSYQTFVEIGVAKGKTTIQLLKYCRKVNGSAIGIDPIPQFEAPKRLQKYWTLHKDFSLNVLESLSTFDCAIIDGDHNWYTVYNELRLVGEKINPKGAIFLHDVAQPWGRRDLYYHPETIPDEFRHPYQKDDKGLQRATKEGGQKNGVMTAVEDFCRENPQWVMMVLPEDNGLGVLQIPPPKKKKR